MKTRQALVGRVALITGASRGIGKAAVEDFLRSGVEVIAVARSFQDTALDPTIGHKSGGTLRTLALDVADPQTGPHLAGLIEDNYGRLDILVGNAGVLGKTERIENIAPEIWARTIDVNLTANWHLIRALHPLLLQSDAGRALFVTSGLAWRGQPELSAYAASKAGLNALVQAYASENRDTALRVNLFSPGPVRTSLYGEAFPAADADAAAAPEDIARHIVSASGPDVTANGQVYDFRTAGWMELQPPATTSDH